MGSYRLNQSAAHFLKCRGEEFQIQEEQVIEMPEEEEEQEYDV